MRVTFIGSGSDEGSSEKRAGNGPIAFSAAVADLWPKPVLPESPIWMRRSIPCAHVPLLQNVGYANLSVGPPRFPFGELIGFAIAIAPNCRVDRLPNPAGRNRGNPGTSSCQALTENTESGMPPFPGGSVCVSFGPARAVRRDYQPVRPLLARFRPRRPRARQAAGVRKDAEGHASLRRGLIFARDGADHGGNRRGADVDEASSRMPQGAAPLPWTA